MKNSKYRIERLILIAFGIMMLIGSIIGAAYGMTISESNWWEIGLGVILLIGWYSILLLFNAFANDTWFEYKVKSLTIIPTILFPFIKRGDIVTILMVPIYFIVFIVYATCWIVVTVLLYLANFPAEIIMAIIVRFKTKNQNQ